VKPLDDLLCLRSEVVIGVEKHKTDVQVGAEFLVVVPGWR